MNDRRDGCSRRRTSASPSRSSSAIFRLRRVPFGGIVDRVRRPRLCVRRGGLRERFSREEIELLVFESVRAEVSAPLHLHGVREVLLDERLNLDGSLLRLGLAQRLADGHLELQPVSPEESGVQAGDLQGLVRGMRAEELPRLELETREVRGAGRLGGDGLVELGKRRGGPGGGSGSADDATGTRGRRGSRGPRESRGSVAARPAGCARGPEGARGGSWEALVPRGSLGPEGGDVEERTRRTVGCPASGGPQSRSAVEYMPRAGARGCARRVVTTSRADQRARARRQLCRVVVDEEKSVPRRVMP